MCRNAVIPPSPPAGRQRISPAFVRGLQLRAFHWTATGGGHHHHGDDEWRGHFAPSESGITAKKKKKRENRRRGLGEVCVCVVELSLMDFTGRD